MDHIDSKFATDALNMAFKPSIHSSLFLAKKTLNRYYDMTDHSEVCHIAMGKFYFSRNFSSKYQHIDMTSQSFIPGTSYLISGMQDGTQSGLKRCEA